MGKTMEIFFNGRYIQYSINISLLKRPTCAVKTNEHIISAYRNSTYEDHVPRARENGDLGIKDPRQPGSFGGI